MKLNNAYSSDMWVDYRSYPDVPSQKRDTEGQSSHRYGRKRLTRKSRTRGAVRLKQSKQSPRFGRLRSVSVLAMLCAAIAGIFATASTTGKDRASDFKSLLLTAAPSPVPVPTFRFDDTEAALSAHAAAEQQLTLIARPQSQAFAPQTFANLHQAEDSDPSVQVHPGTSDKDTADTQSSASNILSPAKQTLETSAAQAPANEKKPPAVSAQKEGLDLVDLSPESELAIATKPSPAQTVMLSPLANKLASQILAPTVEGPSLKENFTKQVDVETGDTFLGILEKQGFPSDQLKFLLKDKTIKENLSHLRIGEKLTFDYRWDGELDNVSVKANRDTRIQIQNDFSGHYTVSRIHLPVEHERVVTSGTIEQSLYLAAERANLKQSTIMELADIFEWELDFARDIRKGDSFSIVYDQLYRDGKYIGDGEILAAKFVRGDRVHNAIRFTDDENNSDYYSPDGQSKRRAFMRHPVDVVRITSRFDPNRLHPVLHKIRAHKGVDYGAPRGAPIYATADGKVAFSGDKNAYGNTVVLQHGDNRETLYAHMSKISKNSKPGARVKRGDVIGYVGKSGRVTGTHLHYEFRIAGKHVDPLKVELPGAPPLDKKYHAKLKARASELFAQMRSVLPPGNEVAYSR